MGLLSAIQVALEALLVNKGRSALTSLGIVIGIAAVIALVSAGSGARLKLDERLTSVGKNLILIRPGARSQQGFLLESRPLTHANDEAIRRSAGHLLAGVAPVQVTQRIVSTRDGHMLTSIVGSIPEIQQVRGWDVVAGRFYNEEDLKRQAPVALIGNTVRQKLFPDVRDPIGEWIRAGHLQLRVIGVLGTKGRSPTGADQDDQVFVPLTTLQRRLVGEERITMLLAATRSEADIDRAKEEITQALRQARNIKPGEQEDFDVSSVREMAELAEVLTATMQLLVGIIASISLVVGGIGIMNIMLVSVTERTREIGIRMAIGATPGDVLTQFLIEAMVLALLGGVLGIALGIAAAAVLAWLAHWPLDISPLVVGLGFGVAAGVGIFFGYYPARKASRLDPIEALRYE